MLPGYAQEAESPSVSAGTASRQRHARAAAREGKGNLKPSPLGRAGDKKRLVSLSLFFLLLACYYYLCFERTDSGSTREGHTLWVRLSGLLPSCEGVWGVLQSLSYFSSSTSTLTTTTTASLSSITQANRMGRFLSVAHFLARYSIALAIPAYALQRRWRERKRKERGGGERCEEETETEVGVELDIETLPLSTREALPYPALLPRASDSSPSSTCTAAPTSPLPTASHKRQKGRAKRRVRAPSGSEGKKSGVQHQRGRRKGHKLLVRVPKKGSKKRTNSGRKEREKKVASRRQVARAEMVKEEKKEKEKVVIKEEEPVVKEEEAVIINETPDCARDISEVPFSAVMQKERETNGHSVEEDRSPHQQQQPEEEERGEQGEEQDKKAERVGGPEEEPGIVEAPRTVDHTQQKVKHHPAATSVPSLAEGSGGKGAPTIPRSSVSVHVPHTQRVVLHKTSGHNTPHTRSPTLKPTQRLIVHHAHHAGTRSPSRTGSSRGLPSSSTGDHDTRTLAQHAAAASEQTNLEAAAFENHTAPSSPLTAAAFASHG